MCIAPLTSSHTHISPKHKHIRDIRIQGHKWKREDSTAQLIVQLAKYLQHPGSNLSRAIPEGCFIFHITWLQIILSIQRTVSINTATRQQYFVLVMSIIICNVASSLPRKSSPLKISGHRLTQTVLVRTFVKSTRRCTPVRNNTWLSSVILLLLM